MFKLTTPVSEDAVRALKVGDEVQISGTIYTGRDAVHKYLHEEGNWKCVAAGPTTSIREEPYQWQVIRDFGLRGVIGKGGMGEKTIEACRQYGCVYLHAVGGAAQVLAECIKRVPNVSFLEKFGAPEAIWEFEVMSFPVIVTIDAHGNSLHKEVLAQSQAQLAKFV